MKILLMQTCDPHAYVQMLEQSSRTAKVFCQRNDIAYMSYIGLCRGSLPMHAMFNRIILIDMLVKSGYNGWVFYCDADTYINDLNFPVRAYLEAHSDKALIAATGGDKRIWAVNDGVFFLNLGLQDGREISNLWNKGFYEQVTDYHLANKEAEWDDLTNDQTLLHQVLHRNPHFIDVLHVDDGKTLNYHGSFIRQALRAYYKTIDRRVEHIRGETDRILK